MILHRIRIAWLVFPLLVLANSAQAETAAAVSELRNRTLVGQLVVHPQNASRFGRVAEDGRIEDIALCGLGSPEGFLYLPPAERDHILGQVERHGGNMLYAIVVRSHGGDGTDQENPFIGHRPGNGLDETILTDWAAVFRRAEKAGIYVFLFVYDDDVAPFGGRHEDAVPEAEKTFFAALMQRFAEHPNLLWCVAEEYDDAFSAQRSAALAAVLEENDPYGRPVAVHHATGDTSFDFRDDSRVAIFALQPRSDSVDSLHADVVAAVRHAGDSAIVHMAENWNNRSRDLALKNDHASVVARGDRTGVRQRNWAVVMAGAGCQVIGPWESTSGMKPATAEMLADMRTLIDFLGQVPLHLLESNDHAAFGDAEWALTDVDRRQAVLYARGGTGKFEIRRFEAGKYEAEWVDCVSGQIASSRFTIPNRGSAIGRPTIIAFERPAGIGPESAVYLRQTEDAIETYIEK